MSGIQDDSEESGFASVSNSTETPSEVIDAPQEEVVVEVAVDTEPPIEEDFAKKLTDFQEESSRKFDKAFGKLGNFEQILDSLKAPKDGKPIELTNEDFAELVEEYPELAEMQIKGLSRALSKLKIHPVVDDSKINEIAQQRAQAIYQESRDKEIQSEIEALKEDHPDWREVVGAPEADNDFRKWLKTQPINYQRKVNRTNDSLVISDSLDSFKDYQKKVAAKAVDDSKRKARIGAAVTPRGSGGNASAGTSEEDGFNSVASQLRARFNK